MIQPELGSVRTGIRRRRTRGHRRNRLIRNILLSAVAAFFAVGLSAVALRHFSPSLFHAAQAADPSRQQAEASRTHLALANQAEEEFRTVCDLVRECLPDLVRLHARLENDWDEPGVQYVVLDETLPNGYPYAQLREQENRLYQREAELVPAPMRERIRHWTEYARE